MCTRFRCAALAAALVLLPSLALAQGHPVELGIDAGGTSTCRAGTPSPPGSRSQGYFRPFAGLTFIHIGSESDTQVARLEGSFTHGFETSHFGGGNALGLSIGLSF